MWFTEQAVDKFGRITPSGVITEFSGVNSPSSNCRGTRRQHLDLERLCLRGGASHSDGPDYDLPDTEHSPRSSDHACGNSNNLLFTEFSANKIASITTNGVVSRISRILPERAGGYYRRRRLQHLVPRHQHQPGLRNAGSSVRKARERASEYSANGAAGDAAAS